MGQSTSKPVTYVAPAGVHMPLLTTQNTTLPSILPNHSVDDQEGNKDKQELSLHVKKYIEIAVIEGKRNTTVVIEFVIQLVLTIHQE